ncbi:MAG: hypothetical protein J4O12_04815 [Chloroflexi bacterium]|nr:hypothetical protein [Chloroflexota bacterium]
MKTIPVATTLSLFAALLLALSVAIACGDDDGNPTSSNSDGDAVSVYFADLQRIFDDADEATSEAEEPLNDVSADAGLDVQLAALDTYLGEINAIFDEAIRQLDDLDVPAVAAAHHQDFIDAVRVSVTAGEALQDDLTNITTDEQLDDRLAEFDSDTDAALDEADAACLRLQEIADTEDVGIDLECEA